MSVFDSLEDLVGGVIVAGGVIGESIGDAIDDLFD